MLSEISVVAITFATVGFKPSIAYAHTAKLAAISTAAANILGISDRNEGRYAISSKLNVASSTDTSLK
jgi:hypothetical protein